MSDFWKKIKINKHHIMFFIFPKMKVCVSKLEFGIVNDHNVVLSSIITQQAQARKLIYRVVAA